MNTVTVSVVTLVIVGVFTSILPVDGSTSSVRDDSFVSRPGASLRRLLGVRISKQRCLWQMDECNPYEDVCCKGMKCANAIGSYCRIGVEKCYCVPISYGKALPYNWN